MRIRERSSVDSEEPEKLVCQRHHVLHVCNTMSRDVDRTFPQHRSRA